MGINYSPVNTLDLFF